MSILTQKGGKLGEISSSAENGIYWGENNPYANDDRLGLRAMDPNSFSVMDAAPMDTSRGSTETGNHTVLATKPRKKTMTSLYLKYFETSADGKSRTCKFCGQSYSISTATGNLGRHLSNRHPGYDETNDSNNRIIVPPQPLTVPKKSPANVRLLAAKPEPDHLNWLLIKWLVESSLPVSALSEKWLIISYRFLKPSLELWPEEKFRTVLHEVHRSMQETVRSNVEQISSSKVSLTLELWTSYEEITYMSVSCGWIDENWTFRKVLLDVMRIPSPCGGPQIYQALWKVLDFYNLGDKVISCTHDNSANVLHACRSLKSDIKVGPFCYVPCASLALNSIIGDGLRSTKPIVSKIREFVMELNSSKSMSEEFSQYAAVFDEGNWVFPVDASARWSGSYQMFDIARKAGKSMEAVASKYEEQLGASLTLNTGERNVITIMHKYLEPFYKTINDMCTNKFLTIGLVLFFMEHITEIITQCRDSRQTPEWLKAACEEMHTRAQDYAEHVSNGSIYMSAVLDPRIKIELLPEYLNSENSYLEEMRNHFVTNYSTCYYASSLASSSSAPYIGQDSDVVGGSFSFAEEIARKRRRASSGSTTTDELAQYLTEPPVPMTTDVLEWWRGNGSRYPRLSCMARDLLALQPTAVGPEVVFCKKGDEVERTRFSMSRGDARALICIKSWVENGVKLRHKSNEIDCERMMMMREH